MDLLSKQRSEVRKRLDGLRAQTTTLESEALDLELADAALAGVGAGPIAEARAALGLDRGAATRKRRLPAKRRDQILAVVRAHPDGIEAPAIAKKVGIKSTHVYQPLRVLEDDGQVTKDGRLYKPVA